MNNNPFLTWGLNVFFSFATHCACKHLICQHFYGCSQDKKTINTWNYKYFLKCSLCCDQSDLIRHHKLNLYYSLLFILHFVVFPSDTINLTEIFSMFTGIGNQSAVAVAISNSTNSCFVFLEIPLTPLCFSSVLSCVTVIVIKLTDCKGVGTKGVDRHH